MIEFKIDNENTGVRLDKVLLAEFDVQFSIIQKFIRKKKITVNKKKIAQDYRCAVGDVIQIFANIQPRIQKTKEKILSADIKSLYIEKLKKMIIFENDQLIAINKPGGLAVQSGSKISLCVDDMIRVFNKNYRLVHRLDRDTSGVLLIAKNLDCARNMTAAFRNGRIEKKYIAVLSRCPTENKGVIKNFIKKTVISNEEKMVVCNQNDDGAVYAETMYDIIGTCKNGLPCVALYPKTGRKHQLRVHCAEVLNTPIFGDIKYGESCDLKNVNHMHLHSEKLIISNKINIIAKLPKYMEDIIL